MYIVAVKNCWDQIVKRIPCASLAEAQAEAAGQVAQAEGLVGIIHPNGFSETVGA